MGHIGGSFLYLSRLAMAPDLQSLSSREDGAMNKLLEAILLATVLPLSAATFIPSSGCE
jgi:hypothetical protein